MSETNNLSPLELKKQELLERIRARNIKETEWIIFIDSIILHISVELTKEERENGIQLFNKRFSIPIDNSIKMLFSSLFNDENNLQINFTPNAKVEWVYHQLEPSENQNTPWYSRWKIEINIHQDNTKEQVILPNKVKVFELLLWDYEVNYHLNNFYNFIKWKKEFLEKEAKFCEDNIIKEIQKSKKQLEMSHKLNTSKLTKILDTFNSKENVGVENKKEDNKALIERRKRWKERSKKWIVHLWKWDNWTTINSLNYSTQWLEILLLSDILECDVPSTRRFIKKLEKMNQKKYLFETNKSVKIIDNTKTISKNEIDTVYRKKKGFITFEWFFDVLSYVRGL